MARGVGGGGRLFEEGVYFKYFHQRGTINQGTAIIRRNTVLLRKCCVGSVSSAAVDYMRSNMFHTSLR